MSLCNDLIDFFDTVSGHEPDGTMKIAPVAHQYGNKKEVIDVTIRPDGSVADDIKIRKDETEPTLLAVTEESASRTSSAATTPHGLNDALYFMTPGYFTGEDGTNISYNAYKEQLTAWCSSRYSCRQAEAVLQCITDNDIVSAILKKYPDADIEKLKKYTVRWSVLSDDIQEAPETWKNEGTLKAWTSFYTDLHHKKGKKAFDVLSGEETDVEEIHPKAVASYGNSKLISTATRENALLNFSGERFTDKAQLPQIGYVSSQKMHNALSWLVKKQSIGISKNALPCCTSDDKPKYLICFSTDPLINSNADMSLLSLFGKTTDKDRNYEEQLANLKKLNFKGQNCFDKGSHVVIAMFDRSGDGRFAPVMYHSYGADEYFAKITDWYDSCSWFRKKADESYGFAPVSITEIAKCACGIPRINDKGRSFFDPSDSGFKDTINTLLEIVLNNKDIPDMLIRKLMRQLTSQASAMKDLRNELIIVACAVTHWKHCKIKKGDKDMSLDRENTDRNYLYGRLLAVYDRIENTVLNRKSKKDANSFIEHRDTNAIREWSAYAAHPKITQAYLQGKAMPYIRSLPYELRMYYHNEIGEIISLLPPDDNGKALRPEYVMGFYHERAYLATKKTDTDTENNTENAEVD